MRPDYLGFLFFTSAIVSFNGALWQISRRKWKKQLLESHKNLQKEPLMALPEKDLDEYRPSDLEFRRVHLEGTFDNEGTMLVGPRALPSHKGGTTAEDKNSGFIVMTPFQVANTDKFLMVNRGWVPIEAGKHRRLLAQYIGEGFAHATLNGIFRKEERMASFWGESPDNHYPMVADLSWLVIRPFDMALYYYSRRWGPDTVEENKLKRGAHHLAVEMVEDFSGDDQRMVRGQAWPRRRDTDELTFVNIAPSTHTMYVGFWSFVTLGSLYGMALCFKRQQMIFAERRAADAMTKAMLSRRQKEAKAFQEAADEVSRKAAEKKY